MAVDHRAEVDELLADYRRTRDQLAQAQRDLAAVSESASSDDGTVTATVSAHGALTALVLTDDAYRRHRPADLGTLIVRTCAAATARAARAANAAIAPVLPSGTDPEALLNGTADLSAAEIAPPVPDDENLEEVTWMQDAREPR